MNFKKLAIVSIVVSTLFTNCINVISETIEAEKHIHKFDVTQNVDKTDVHFMDFLESKTNCFYHVEDYEENYVMYMNDETDDTITVFYDENEIVSINFEFVENEESQIIELVNEYYNLDEFGSVNGSEIESNKYLENELIFKYSQEM